MSGILDPIIAKALEVLGTPMSQTNSSITIGHLVLFFAIILVLALALERR